MLSTAIADKIKTLATAKAKVAQLEQALVHELRDEFASMHARFGFPDRQAFLDAVKAAGSKRPAGKRRRRAPKARALGARQPAKAKAQKPAGKKRRRRA